MKSKRGIDTPSNLRIERELAKKAFEVPIVFHAMPRSEKVLCFDAHEVGGALGFVSFDERATEHDSLAFSANYFICKNGWLVSEANFTASTNGNNGIGESLGNANALQPRLSALRQIKSNKAAILSEQSMTDSVHGFDVATATAPDFAVKVNANRESFTKPVGRIDDISAASPKDCAVPIGAASVKLLAPKPTRAITEIPITGEGHLCFVHAKTLSQTSKHCHVRLNTERHGMSYAR